MAAQQFNDQQCRRADDPAHRCTDKFGDWFASPLRPARPGAVCWWETIMRLEDERLAEHAALQHLADSSTLDAFAQPYDPAPTADEQAFLDWLDSYTDVDFRESEAVR